MTCWILQFFDNILNNLHKTFKALSDTSKIRFFKEMSATIELKTIETDFKH